VMRSATSMPGAGVGLGFEEESIFIQNHEDFLEQ